MKIYLLLFALLTAHVRAEWERILDEDTYSITSDGERLYAATDRGILFSRDDGDTWRPSDYKDGDVEYLTASPHAIYGYSSEHHILRSVTKGNTWHPINAGFNVRLWENGKWVNYIPRVEQFLVTSSGKVIAVCYHQGTWISRDRGDNWHEITDEWKEKDHGGTLGDSIWSMGEFGGYLWLALSGRHAARSPDEGATWEIIPIWGHGRTLEQFDRANVWVEFGGNLYIAGGSGFGRWREAEFMWEHLFRRRFRSTKRLYGDGLPESLWLISLAVHRNRFFAGSRRHGVFMFDPHAETWRPAGLPDKAIRALVSHRGGLYVASEGGIYRANLQFVTPEGKTAITWGAVKRGKLP